MRKHLLLLIPLLLALPAALSGCATQPPVQVLASCPPLPPVPAPLMQSPPKPLRTASKLQSLLFEQATKPIGGRTDSMPK